jgi:ParB family transcriptional regulator, chromosome partitioning protein
MEANMVAQFNAFPDKNKQGVMGTVEVWDLKRIKPNPLNPRGEIHEDDPSIQELAISIKEHGLLEPILVTRNGMCVAGHRRRVACVIAGVERARVIVKDYTEQEQLEIMLIENLQREGLDAIQEANAYLRLKQQGLKVAEIIRRTGLHLARVTNHLAMTELPAEVQEFFRLKQLPMYAAPVLKKLESAEQQLEYAKNAIRMRWTVSRLSDAITGKKPTQNTSLKPVARDTDAVLTREVALASLQRKSNFPVSLEQFARAANRISCACSAVKQSKHGRLCQDCPYANFLGELLKEVFDVKN